jgi:predicted secreted protein with PEFG-CTERM motif
MNTDKSSYTLGDTIVISGAVQSVVFGTPLTVQILDPTNSLVQVAQIDVSQDGKYTDTIKAVGTLWKLNGAYIVKVQYGPPNVTAQATFTFQSSITPTSNVFPLKDPNSQQTFNVNYTISGGTVKTMTIDAQSLSVIVSVNSTSDGTITVQLPRTLIDAKTNSGQDDAFIILIDGAEVKPQSESSDNNFRNLTIQFLQGDQDIEIIGTQIIPEFGPIAALVFAIAIISIIAVSAKTGLRFMPKY